MAQAAAAALLLWRDWWLSSHFCLRLRALRRISRLSALLFALAGAPFARFLQFQVANGHQVIYIVNCTISCTKYSRPALAMNRSDDLFFVCGDTPSCFCLFFDPFGSRVSDLNIFSFIVQYNQHRVGQQRPS